MFGIGFTELILIIFIILLIFGAGRLPKIGESLGRMVGELKKYQKKKGGEK